MTKYEYRREMRPGHIDVDFLNDQGAEGWQLVHAEPTTYEIYKGRPELRIEYFFMREKEEFIDPDEILGVGSAGDPI